MLCVSVLPLHRMFSFQEFELVHFASISEILQRWENKKVCSIYVPTKYLRTYGKWKMIVRCKIFPIMQFCKHGKPCNSAWHGKWVTKPNLEKYTTSSANKILSCCLVYGHYYVVKHSRILIEIKGVESSMFFTAAVIKRFVLRAKT